MNTKSASNILHGILVQHPIGYEFDVRMLQEEAMNYGYNFSEGALTGFITRAINKEIVSIKGTIRPKGTNRTRRLYTLVGKQDWAFKPAGIGSYPGREIHSKARDNDQLTLLSEPEQEITKSSIIKSSIIKIAAKKMGIPVIDIPLSDHDADALIGLPKAPARKHDPTPSLVDLMFNHAVEESISEPEEEEYETGSLADQLMELAIQVNDLEKKEPSLSGFTTDELLEELRSRVK